MSKVKLLQGFVCYKDFSNHVVRESVCGVSEIDGVCYVTLQSGWCIPLSDDEVHMLECAGSVDVRLSSFRVIRRGRIAEIDWERRRWELFNSIVSNVYPKIYTQGEAMMGDIRHLMNVYIGELKKTGLYES